MFIVIWHFFVALLGYIIATKSVSMHQWCRALAGEWHFWRQVVIRWLRSRGVWCDERARASLSSPRHRYHYDASQDGRRAATFCALNHRSPRHCRKQFFHKQMICLANHTAIICTTLLSAMLFAAEHFGVGTAIMYQWRHIPLRAYSSGSKVVMTLFVVLWWARCVFYGMYTSRVAVFASSCVFLLCQRISTITYIVDSPRHSH